jgi:hypothetical protein
VTVLIQIPHRLMKMMVEVVVDLEVVLEEVRKK